MTRASASGPAAPEPTRSSREGIGRRVDAVRSVLVRRAGLASLLWVLILAAVVLGLAWLLSGPDGWRRGSPAPLVLDLALLAVALGGVAWVALGFRRRLTDARIADGMDRVGGLGRGTVLGSLELSRGTPPGVSAALARSSELKVLRALPSEPTRLAEPLAGPLRRWTRRAAGALVFAACALALLTLTHPGRARSAWGGLLRPSEVLSTPRLATLRVEPSGGMLPRGSHLAVVVQAPGRERVRLQWQFDGDVPRGGEARVEGGEARFDLGSLDAPVEYRATTPDGAHSERIRLIPQDPLLVTELRVELTYPPHTGRDPQQFVRDVPPLRVPAGTELRFEGRASRDLRVAGLRRTRPADEKSGEVARGGEKPDVALAVTGDHFSGRWRPLRSGRYVWTLEGRDGSDPNALPAPLELTVVPDSAPTVELLSPGVDTVLPLDRKQPMVIRATDDYGLRSLELIAYKVSSFGKRGDPVVQSLRTGGIRAAVARPVLDVSDWDLLPGDTVRYRARVADNGPHPQVAQTREYVLRVARSSEAARVMQEQLAATVRAVDSLAAEAARAQQETQELERTSEERKGDQVGGQGNQAIDAASSQASGGGAGPESSFESREEVQRAVERQQNLVNKADSIREALSQARQSLESAALADPALRRDLEELESLMQRVAPEELRKQLKQTSKGLDKMSPRDMSDALKKLSNDQESFRKRVEESLDRFRKAATDQDFRATSEEAQDLADDQSALADAMKTGEQSQRRASQQEGLEKRAQDLKKRMNGLQNDLSRLGAEKAEKGVQDASKQLADAAEQMKKASTSSRQKKSSDAAQSAEKAADQLRKSARTLDQVRSQMGQDQSQHLRQAFRQTSTDALSLARRQGELQRRMQRARTREEQTQVRSEEGDVMQGLKNLQSKLEQPLREAPEAGRPVKNELNSALSSLQQTLNDMGKDKGGGTPMSTSTSQETIASLNRAAQAAAGAAQQGGGQGGGGSGTPQFQRKLQQVAQQQGKVAEKTSSLSPMQLGPSTLKEMLGKMAGAQEAVGSQVGQLADRPGAGGAMGDLGKMADEAKALAQRLRQGRLDAETVHRQNELFHRLLDAGRTLEKEELSSERQSHTATAVAPVAVEPLTAEDLGGARFSLPRADVLQALPPAQRALVVQYFERLNRSDAPSGDGGGGR